MAYSNRVEFTDGTVEYMQRRERPHLLYSPTDSNRIVALSNGVIDESSPGLAGDRYVVLYLHELNFRSNLQKTSF